MPREQALNARKQRNAALVEAMLLAAMADGDTLRTQLAALRRLLKVTPVNTVVMRRRLAEATTAKGAYIF